MVKHTSSKKKKVPPEARTIVDIISDTRSGVPIPQDFAAKVKSVKQPVCEAAKQEDVQD